MSTQEQTASVKSEPQKLELTKSEQTFSIKSILKRDGKEAPFEKEKILLGIIKAAQEAEIGPKDFAEKVTQEVLRLLEEQKSKTLTTELIGDLVEKTLMEKGHVEIAKSFILHRHKKAEEQQRRALILGNRREEENLEFSDQALKILGRRYLLKDVQGNLLETPQQILIRVATNIAQADALYEGTEAEVKATAEEFYQAMAELRFLPNSPTLMNAGTKVQQLSSCFVLPVEDTMEGIFGSLKDAAIIHQRGSGTGFAFSRLRPKGDFVKKNMGVAAGVVEFLRVYDAALESIKQGGVRKGANMAVLRVDHPDIIRFIESKRDKKSLKNFNISVAVTDRFMKAVEEDKQYYLTNPRTGKYVGKLRAKDVFALITQNAWKTGDPGLIFIDEINRKHPGKHLGDIETTNQCGEAPLLPYEGCALGSLNLVKFIDKEKKDLDWEKLKETIQIAVHFLDNVIDMNSYPKLVIAELTKRTRKFGLGIMGLADIFCKLKLKYDSEEALELADKLMTFIKEVTYEKSAELAKKRGACPAWKGSDHYHAGRKMRNMSCLSVSPTGTISILGDASSGCEPLFALAYHKTVLGDTEFLYMNKEFEKIAREREFYSPELMNLVAKTGSIQGIKEIPKDVRDIFVTAQDIGPEWHIKMQAVLQKHVDNSISKTINFPATAAIKDVEEAYLLAWKMKCKGITIYRDGSYEEQVMNIGE